MGMSDRIVIMRSGRIDAILDNKNLTADALVKRAIGAHEVAA
jgi:rhamnose transport system ATP-binding protein